MKKLLFALFTFATVTAWAQGFEGTIKWSMKMEITDPAMKAKMEASQKSMNDPAQQAKMKEMQDKMNDPKMKAMMDANPQMKAMMENAMKMQQGGSSADVVNSMMPKGMIVKIKDGNSLVTMDGGMAGDMLYTKDRSVHLDRTNKTYSVLPSGQPSDQSGTKPTVTKTNETTKIMGYTCTKYIVTTTMEGHTSIINEWATTEIKGMDIKAMMKQRMSRGQSIFYEGVEGYPLRTEMQTPQGIMTMEVIDFKSESLNASDFIIPSDYKETQGMFGGPR